MKYATLTETIAKTCSKWSPLKLKKNSEKEQQSLNSTKVLNTLVNFPENKDFIKAVFKEIGQFFRATIRWC